MNFKRINNYCWEFICPTCKKVIKIRKQPKNWDYKVEIKNKKAWSSEFAYTDLILYCSQNCKDKSLGL